MLRRLAAEAPAVVADAEDDTRPGRLERDLDPRRLRMAGYVREALLRDPVDGELGRRSELRQRLAEAPVDLHPRGSCEGPRQLGERADEAELLEHLGPELA